MKEELEMKCCSLIAQVGDARSSYVEAVRKASEGKLDEAEILMKNGHTAYVYGHKIHAELMMLQTGAEDNKDNLLLMHAEDQLMSAETVEIMAEQFICLYQKLQSDKGGEEG